MRSISRKHRLIGAAIAACVLILMVVLLLRGGEEQTTEIAGMEMTQAEVDEMVRDSMAVSSLSKIDVTEPDDTEAQLQPERSDGTATFELEAKPLRWSYRDKQSIAAWGFEGQVPGPQMRVREGERVKVVFTNNLPDPTTVHWHGLDVPFEADGVPGVTQEPVKPGDSYTYEFVAKPAGTHFYHAHGSGMGDEARQLDMGLAGALIVEPAKEPKADIEQTLVLDEWQVEPGGLNAAMMAGAGHEAHNAGFNLFTINGRSAPDWSPIHVERGQTVRLRMINAGTSTTHPMHLHGHNFSITAVDGNPVPAAAVQRRNTVVLAPGETYDITFIADNPGVWMLHCHELHHADAGMMTIMQYEGSEPVGEHGETGDDEDKDKDEDAEGGGHGGGHEA